MYFNFNELLQNYEFIIMKIYVPLMKIRPFVKVLYYENLEPYDIVICMTEYSY